jgi:hypothetical protein
MLTFSMYIGLVEERKKESARDSVSAGFDHSPTTLAVSRFCLGGETLGSAREGVSGKVLDFARPSCEMQEVSKRTVAARLELARQYRAALRCGLRSQRIGGVFIEGPGCDTATWS